jgi:hypothetical protein
MTVMFPEFIRRHLKKDEMSSFYTNNIQGFKVKGVEMPCTVELTSGPSFTTTLSISAKFFTPKNADVLKHWHLQYDGNGVDLLPRDSVPIGLDMSSNQRDELRKKVKEYISGITQEPEYASQLTTLTRHTEIPLRVLRLVQQYYRQSDAPIVKKAMSIYAMHYVMAMHLTMTRQNIVSLRDTKLVPQNEQWVTPRMLNRQIKAVVDEMLIRETQTLYEAFSKSLKPKSRREWAPCTAAFLVLCLLMEGIEAANDRFVVGLNEVDLRNKRHLQWDRKTALNANTEVENMPFKQFAYQFHQIYQTHVKDVGTRAFNPVLDDSVMEELDPSGRELALGLRELVRGQSCKFSSEDAFRLGGGADRDAGGELELLAMDPIMNNMEHHPFPRVVDVNYTGRMTAKFLLSFVDETYIFGRDI